MGVLTGLRIVVALLATAAVGYWLFADTARYHLTTETDAPLRLSFWGSYQEYEMWKRILADFRELHPDIPVRIEFIPTRYEDKIRQLLVADAAPDVMLFQDEPMPGFLRSEKFEDLTPWLDTPGYEVDLDAYWPTAVESFVRDEPDRSPSRRVYGIPVWGGCNLLFYSKPGFARAKVRVGENPDGRGIVEHDDGWWTVDDRHWTVEQWERVAERLTRDFDGDGRLDQYGMHQPHTLYWLPWHWALGASILDASRTHTTFYGPETEASLALLQRLRFGDPPISPMPAELSGMNAGVGFYTGLICMVCTGPWEMPFLNATDIEYDLLHTPRGPGGRATRITWDCLMMFRGSKRKLDAWKLIHFASSMRGQREVAATQRSIPARREAASLFIEGNPTVNAAKFIEAAADYARMQPITEHWQLMYNVWNRATETLTRESLADRLTPAEAIGRFYLGEAGNDVDSAELTRVLPPADPDQAMRYRRVFLESGKSR